MRLCRLWPDRGTKRRGATCGMPCMPLLICPNPFGATGHPPPHLHCGTSSTPPSFVSAATCSSAMMAAFLPVAVPLTGGVCTRPAAEGLRPLARPAGRRRTGAATAAAAPRARPPPPAMTWSVCPLLVYIVFLLHKSFCLMWGGGMGVFGASVWEGDGVWLTAWVALVLLRVLIAGAPPAAGGVLERVRAMYAGGPLRGCHSP